MTEEQTAEGQKRETGQRKVRGWAQGPQAHGPPGRAGRRRDPLLLDTQGLAANMNNFHRRMKTYHFSS